MYSMFDLLAWAAKLVRLRPSWGGGRSEPLVGPSTDDDGLKQWIKHIFIEISLRCEKHSHL